MVSPSVLAPDLKPTPAQIASSIARGMLY